MLTKNQEKQYKTFKIKKTIDELFEKSERRTLVRRIDCYNHIAQYCNITILNPEIMEIMKNYLLEVGYNIVNKHGQRFYTNLKMNKPIKKKKETNKEALPIPDLQFDAGLKDGEI